MQKNDIKVELTVGVDLNRWKFSNEISLMEKNVASYSSIGCVHRE